MQSADSLKIKQQQKKLEKPTLSASSLATHTRWLPSARDLGVSVQPLPGRLGTGLLFAWPPGDCPLSSRPLLTSGPAGEAFAQPWTSPWERTGDGSPLGPERRPSPPRGQRRGL